MTAGSMGVWPKPGGNCWASRRREARASRHVVAIVLVPDMYVYMYIYKRCHIYICICMHVVAVVLVPDERCDSDRAEVEWGEPGRHARPREDSVPCQGRVARGSRLVSMRATWGPGLVSMRATWVYSRAHG